MAGKPRCFQDGAEVEDDGLESLSAASAAEVRRIWTDDAVVQGARDLAMVGFANGNRRIDNCIPYLNITFRFPKNRRQHNFFNLPTNLDRKHLTLHSAHRS